ncbi:hypothetical protein ABW20_dc0109568 [Dactylellina cionopaga]|nr:hypothetical protein ABW20_dc0109568 [Dactylellina cionopaga]
MVVPGKNMGIRPTINVDTNGRSYHPYLAYWAQNPDKSTLVDLCSELKTVFSKEPPLYSKQPPPAAHPQAGPATPPPRPPLPQEIEAQRAQAHPTAGTPQQSNQPPPPPPPKAELQHQTPAAYAYTTTPHLYAPQTQSAPQPVASPPTQPPQSNKHGPPERPALPQKVPHEEARPAYQVTGPAYQQRSQTQAPPPPPPPPVPPIPLLARNSIAGPPDAHQPPLSRYQQPASPPPTGPPQHHWSPQLSPHAHRLSGQYDVPINRFPISQPVSPRPISFHGYPNHQAASGPSKLGPQPVISSPKPKFNLLDGDDGSMLPISAASAVPPPLPPNPEKDRLINEIAKVLQQKAEAASTKTGASLEQTASQAEAMAKTEAYMERERIELIRVNDMCEKDQRILKERIAMADDLIRDVRDREAPNIDAVVVAPTVVHNQLYELVTDDMAIEDTIYVLGKALDKERITLDVFLKHTRALAREQFMKRALVKKISKQIGMA